MLLRGASDVHCTGVFFFLFSDIPFDYGSYGLLFRMILRTSAWVLVRFTAHTIHIGREEAKQDILSLFAPPPRSQLGNWNGLVSSGEIHCRSIDWEEAK